MGSGGCAAVSMARAFNPVDRLVGQNVRIFRTAKRMSQTELGTAIGVTFQQVQKYEKGTNRIGSGRLSQIAKVLGLPVGRLFDDTTTGAAGAKVGEVVTDLLVGPYAIRMLQAFSKISDVEMRRALLSLVESIAAQGKR
jgi:transcriptional regulator with XRE-family HTH domain